MVAERAEDQWREWLRLPLEYALCRGDIGFARTLLEAGADVGAAYKGIFSRRGRWQGRRRCDAQCGLQFRRERERGVGERRATSGRSPSPLPHSLGGFECRGTDRTRSLTAVQLLIKFGAAIDAQDWFGDTPLHTAIAPGFEDPAAVLLISRGASQDAESGFGLTPLDDEGAFLSARVLLAAGVGMGGRRWDNIFFLVIHGLNAWRV